MKIFLISNMYPSKESLFYGIFVKTFVDNMEEQDIKISSEAIIKGRTNNSFLKLYKYIKFFLQTYKGLLLSNYDLIYIHSAKHSLLPFFPIYFLIKKPMVINAHGNDIRYSSFIGNLVKPIIKKSDALVVPSNSFRSLALSKKLNNNIIVSPSGGINTDKFKPIEQDVRAKDFVIGYISRIDKDKGWETLICATKLLTDRIPNLKVIIIGQGDQEKDLKQLIERSNLNNKIRLLGPKANDELAIFYNTFNLFVFPSLKESLGVVGLESLSCGIPVIGSKIAPIDEYVIPGFNGYLFEPEDPEDLAEKIFKFYSLNEKKQMEFKNNAYETSRKYNSVKVAKTLKVELLKLS